MERRAQDDRAPLAQALIDRLGAQALQHQVLAVAPVMQIAVAREAFERVPAFLAAYCREFDLRLVHLSNPEHARWRAVMAWSDELGRPGFLEVEAFSDWCRGLRRLLAGHELLRATPDVRFALLLAQCVARCSLTQDEARQLSLLWQEEPRGAMERVAQFWRRPSDMRAVSGAAKHGDWSGVRASLPALARAMLRGAPLYPPAALTLARRLGEHALAPRRTVIAVAGESAEQREAVRAGISRDLSPAFPEGLQSFAHALGEFHGGDLQVALGGPTHAERLDDALAADPAQPLPSLLAQIDRSVLRWLECRVERRYPEALVGRNPIGARLLQAACRLRIPVLAPALQSVLNCDLECRLGAPILMPHPYGIVIEHGAEIGNRVTVMQQATIAAGGWGAAGGAAPVIEDNVYIGPGARIIGRVRVGRGAKIGANAVVTRDVPSHCTVIGVNHVLGGRERRGTVPEGSSSPAHDETRARVS